MARVTTFNEAENAVLKHFIQVWDSIVVDGVNYQGRYVFDNTFYKDAAPWARATVSYATNTLEGFGSLDLYQRAGTNIIQVFVPLNEGTRLANMLIDPIVVGFEGVKTDGVSFYDVVPERFGPNGGWHQTNISMVFDWFVSHA